MPTNTGGARHTNADTNTMKMIKNGSMRLRARVFCSLSNDIVADGVEDEGGMLFQDKRI